MHGDLEMRLLAALGLALVERGRVLAHEVFRPGDAGEVGRESALAETDTPPAVAVSVPGAMFRQAASCPDHRSTPRLDSCVDFPGLALCCLSLLKIRSAMSLALFGRNMPMMAVATSSAFSVGAQRSSSFDFLSAMISSCNLILACLSCS